MVRLTKTQRDVLEQNEILSVSSITGNVWGRKGGFSLKVQRRTFEALRKAGLYALVRDNGLTAFYERTPAGRQALEEQ